LGLVLLITGVVLLATGRIRPAYAPETERAAVYIEIFALYMASMAGFILIQWLLWQFRGVRVSLAWSWVFSAVVPVVVVWGLWRGQSWVELRRGLGWHGGRGWYIEMPLGIAGYVSGLPIVIVGFVITFLLLKFSSVTPSHPVQTAETDSIWQILGLYGIACVWAPVIEETMFRGAFFHHMRTRWNWIISAGVVSLIFAAIHPQGWTFIPVLGAIAVVLAGLREWRGSILAPMVAHACNNFMMISLLVALK
jgi:membrane protease YdiL (CAAX protease family)